MTESMVTPSKLAARWVEAFGHALEGEPDEAALRDLFLEDSHWRDLIAFTWDVRQVSGRDGVIERLVSTSDWVAPHNFRVSPYYLPPTEHVRTGHQVIEVFFEFDATYGSGLALARLEADPSAPAGSRAWTLLTQIESVKDAKSVRRIERPNGVGYDKKGGKVNWASLREKARSFEDRDPDVLIVGGGQAGVMLAANLNLLGIDNLVVDAHRRVGDNWRTRYDSLQLHNQIQVVQFPYMPFPAMFPEYIPKDKLANWFEAYVDAMEINFWTSSRFVNGRYDEAEGRWTVTLDQGDGKSRTLHPRHIVMTTGGTGVFQNIPSLPGLDSFKGDVVLSKDYHNGANYSGKNVLVVGVGTSAHDIAYNLAQHDAGTITMLQRGSVTVTSLESANSIFGLYDLGLPLVDADTITSAGWVEPVQRANLQVATKINDERDKDLLDALRKAGMRLDDGDYHTGWIRKFITRGGGYYINVGASELIIDGRVGIVQTDDLETFDEKGMVLKDGRTIPLDAVVFATGFKNQESATREQFGDEVADRVGRIGGYDDEFEVKAIWRPTGQPGLWFGTGSIQNCRTFSPLVAMQLKAELTGLAPTKSDRMVSSAS